MIFPAGVLLFMNKCGGKFYSRFYKNASRMGGVTCF
jgi:hypothetical protein